MPSYRAFGVSFHCDWQFRNLPASEEVVTPDFTVDLIARAGRENPDALKIITLSDGFEMRVPDIGAYIFRPKQKRLQIDFFENLSPDKIETSILNQAIPFALAAQGELLLHGCALANRSEAYLFLGRTGSGKSNLALMALSKGWTVLADDFVRISMTPQPVVHFSFPEIRISPADFDRLQVSAIVAADMPKGRLGFQWHPQDQQTARRIHKIFVIQTPTQVEDDRQLSWADRFGCLMDNSLFYPTGSRAQEQARFAKVTALLEQVPVEFIKSPAGLGLAPNWLDVNF